MPTATPPIKTRLTRCRALGLAAAASALATIPALAVDLDAIRSRPGRRVACAACGEEIINERETVVAGQMWCRGCAGERHFLSLERT